MAEDFSNVINYGDWAVSYPHLSREVHEKLPAVVERIAQETAATFRAEAEVEYNLSLIHI